MAHVPHGMMRLVAAVQNPTAAVDSLGQWTETWANVSGLSALPIYIEQMDTTETVDDGGPAIQTSYRILCPWTASVTTRSRFLWTDNGTQRTLNVRSCTDKDQRRRTLEVEAVEVVL
jgi:head-tail adaptor